MSNFPVLNLRFEGFSGQLVFGDLQNLSALELNAKTTQFLKTVCVGLHCPIYLKSTDGPIKCQGPKTYGLTSLDTDRLETGIAEISSSPRTPIQEVVIKEAKCKPTTA